MYTTGNGLYKYRGSVHISAKLGLSFYVPILLDIPDPVPISTESLGISIYIPQSIRYTRLCVYISRIHGPWCLNPPAL